jgi:hypothetical protein
MLLSVHIVAQPGLASIKCYNFSMNKSMRTPITKIMKTSHRHRCNLNVTSYLQWRIRARDTNRTSVASKHGHAYLRRAGFDVTTTLDPGSRKKIARYFDGKFSPYKSFWERTEVQQCPDYIAIEVRDYTCRYDATNYWDWYTASFAGTFPVESNSLIIVTVANHT